MGAEAGSGAKEATAGAAIALSIRRDAAHRKSQAAVLIRANASERSMVKRAQCAQYANNTKQLPQRMRVVEHLHRSRCKTASNRI
jgi:uncharacterized ferredoxin-like protein